MSFLVLGEASIQEGVTGLFGIWVSLVNHSHGFEIMAGPPVLLTFVSRNFRGSLILSSGTRPESCDWQVNQSIKLPHINSELVIGICFRV